MPSATVRTSGDMTADSRYAYAAAAAADGDHAAAADMFAQALERAPHFACAAFGLAVACEHLNRRDEARAAFLQTLALAPADELGAALHLARMQGTGAPPAPPPAYVAALFDQYAPTFDTHLTTALGYDGPQVLLDAVARHSARRFPAMLDLGCGTGLAAAAFEAVNDVRAGVDLSAGMVAQAHAKGLYHRLAVGDAVEFLAAEPEASADLILAADVMPYVGEPGGLFAAAARVLRPDGLFAFTAQSAAAGLELGSDLRYAHSPDCLASAAHAARLRIVTLETASIRRDRGVPVPGLVAVLAKPAQ